MFICDPLYLRLEFFAKISMNIRELWVRLLSNEEKLSDRADFRSACILMMPPLGPAFKHGQRLNAEEEQLIRTPSRLN